MSMLFKRIKDWATSITAFRTGDVIPVDGPDGTAKMSKDDLLKETAENAVNSGVAASVEVVADTDMMLFGYPITGKVPSALTTATEVFYSCTKMQGHTISLDYTNDNASGTAYFTVYFYDSTDTEITAVRITGSANGGQTKTYKREVPANAVKFKMRSPAYVKASWSWTILDPIVDNFEKSVVAEPRFNYNNLADVVVEPGETKQVRVNTNTYFPICLKGKKLTIKSIIDCPISTTPTNFGYWDSMTYDAVLGQWTLKKSVTVSGFKVNDANSNAFMYSSYTNNTGSPIVAKLNKVIYEFENASDADVYRRYLSQPDQVKDLDNFWTYEIHVGLSYDSDTEGFGVTRFASPYQAVNACKGHGHNQLEHCKVVIDEEGVYDISSEIAPQVGATSTSYLGMVLDSYVPSTGVGKHFEMVSANIQNPAGYEIKFDGAYNYGADMMPTDQGTRIALIHIAYTSYAKIKGIKFTGKNGRYCIHPEFGRNSTGSDILFENCIFKWEGAPQVTNYNGNAVGMGLDAGDKITFKKCQWVSAEDGGVYSNSFAHNNGYSGATDFILSGATLIYDECDMGGWTHGSYSNNNPNQKTHDIVELFNCVNIGGVTIPSGSNWRLVNVASDIPS